MMNPVERLKAEYEKVFTIVSIEFEEVENPLRVLLIFNGLSK
jgi:hypothetical protein